MTNLKKIEEEFDKKFQPICNIWVNQGITENIKAFYRQAIKDLMLEAMGEDEEYPPANELMRETKATIIQGKNQAKSEIRSRINKMFEEK